MVNFFASPHNISHDVGWIHFQIYCAGNKIKKIETSCLAVMTLFPNKKHSNTREIIFPSICFPILYGPPFISVLSLVNVT